MALPLLRIGMKVRITGTRLRGHVGTIMTGRRWGGGAFRWVRVACRESNVGISEEFLVPAKARKGAKR
jgi:hypothetical protein